MPILTYTPEGADPIVFEFAFDKLMSPEAIAIEKLTGLTLEEVGKKFLSSSVTTTHALLYVLMKRNHPTLKPDELQFTTSEIAVELTVDETRSFVERYDAGELPVETDAQRAALEELRTTLPPEVEDEPEDPTAPKD